MADSPREDSSDDSSEIGSWRRQNYTSITESHGYSYRLTHDISLDSFRSEDLFETDSFHDPHHDSFDNESHPDPHRDSHHDSFDNESHPDPHCDSHQDSQGNNLDNSSTHKDSSPLTTDNTDVDKTPTKSKHVRELDRVGLEEDMIELDLDLTAETNVINKEDIIRKTQGSASYLLNILEEETKPPTHKSSKHAKGSDRGHRSHKEKRTKRRRTGRKLPQMPTSKAAGSLPSEGRKDETKTPSDEKETEPEKNLLKPSELNGNMDAPSPDENNISTPPPDTPTTSDNSNIPESPSDSPESHIATETTGMEFNATSTHYTPFLSNTNMLLQEDSSPDEKPSRRFPGRHRSVNRKQKEAAESSDEEKTGFHPATLVINGVLKRQSHKVIYSFFPRHEDEMRLEVGDPIYVEAKCEDLWFEGINLKTADEGCFPGQYVAEYTGDAEAPFGLKGRRIHINRYHVKFLGSIEVPFHKGNDILCRAMQKVVTARRMTLELHPPTPCILEISDNGVKMVDKTKPPKISPKKDSMMKKVEKLLSGRHNKGHNYYFSLKNVSFCGFHPASSRYFAFITKHPTDRRFACHVFVTDAGESAKQMVEAMGAAFKRFYSEFLDFTNPTEDIYME